MEVFSWITQIDKKSIWYRKGELIISNYSFSKDGNIKFIFHLSKKPINQNQWQKILILYKNI